LFFFVVFLLIHLFLFVHVAEIERMLIRHNWNTFIEFIREMHWLVHDFCNVMIIISVGFLSTHVPWTDIWSHHNIMFQQTMCVCVSKSCSLHRNVNRLCSTKDLKPHTEQQMYIIAFKTFLKKYKYHSFFFLTKINSIHYVQI
jgi:hypothetical protein